MGADGRARHHAWAQNLGLSAGVTLLFLGVLELGARALFDASPAASPIRGGYISMLGEHDPLLFWRMKANLVDVEGRISTNRLGLRGPEIPQKAAGELRVLSLGESTTLAPRLDYDDSYSVVLERLLDAYGSRRPVRVINAGVSGYSLFQGYQYLVHRGLLLEPDVVVSYFGYNDFLETTFLAQRAGGALTEALDDWELFERRQRLAVRLSTWLTGHSRLYQRLATPLAAADEDARIVRSKRPRVPEEHRRRLLTLLADRCDAEGIELVLVVPLYRSFREHAPLLREFAQQRGLPIVDLPATLPAKLDGRLADHFIDPAHPRPHVHRLIAEALFTAIEGRPPPADPRESTPGPP